MGLPWGSVVLSRDSDRSYSESMGFPWVGVLLVSVPSARSNSHPLCSLRPASTTVLLWPNTTAISNSHTRGMEMEPGRGLGCNPLRAASKFSLQTTWN